MRNPPSTGPNATAAPTVAPQIANAFARSLDLGFRLSEVELERTAEVLRHNKKPKLNITWDKDRGKDVESAPWFHKFNGDRINDHHLTVAEKITARQSEGGEKP